MANAAFELFDEFAVRHARGEYPDPVEYLDRAGEHGDELAGMLDRFLRWAPPPAPEPAAVMLMEAWLAGDPPLLALRVEKGLRVDDVVAYLAERLQVAASKRSKLRRYFQRLEGGLLDASRVNERVFDALGSFLGAPRSLLVTWASPPRGAISRAATARAYRGAASPGAAPAAPPAAPDGEWDNLDELFLGAREA